MKANLPSLASAKERLQNRIQNARTPSDRKLLSKSPAEEFEESTADLTSAATSYQHSLQTPQSASKPKVQRLSGDRPEPPDCYQSVVSDVTWQEQEVASSAGRRSLSSKSLLSPQAQAPTSLYHHGYSTSIEQQQPHKVGTPSSRSSKHYGNYSTTLSKSSSSRPQHKLHRPSKRSSMESVVSELTWNEPMSQESSLLEAPRSPVENTETGPGFWSTSSPPPKTTTVLEKLGRKTDISEADYFASTRGYRAAYHQRESSSHLRQPMFHDDSISSIVSDVTWIDLDNSAHRGGPTISSTTDASPPDSRSRSPARSKSSFHDSGVSELTFMNSESSLKISDLMRTSIMEAANESSGSPSNSPSNSGGSKELQGSSSSKESSSRELTEFTFKMALEKSISDARTAQEAEKKLASQKDHHALRKALKENDAMPRIPTRRMSSSSDDALLTESDLEDLSQQSSEISLKPSTSAEDSKEKPAGGKEGLPLNSEHSVEKSKIKKRRGPKKRGDTDLKLSQHSTDSAFEDSGEKATRSKKRAPKSGAKSKSTGKSKKGKKKKEEVPLLDNTAATKPKKKGKKKKSKDSDRSKLDDSEHDYEGKLKEAPITITKKKKKKKKRLDDSERTTASAVTLKTKIARKRPEESERTVRTVDSEGTLKTKITNKKKLHDSSRSLLGESDRTNTSSTSTFDADQLPELKEIGIPKTRRRGELDGSNHSTQSAFEFGSSGQQMGSGRRSSRGRSGDLDTSLHSVQSCLELQTTKLSIPKPSALAGAPTRPALVRHPSDTKHKSVTFMDGERSRPPVPFTKKEVSRDWGEASLDRLPTMSLPSRGSPASLRAKRVSQAKRRDSMELMSPPTRAPDFNPTGPSDGVNFLLDRLSGISPDVESNSRHDAAPLIPRPRLSQDTFDGDFSPGATVESPQQDSPRDNLREKLSLKPPRVSPPKLDAREKLGLKPMSVPPPPSMVGTPTGKRVIGKHARQKLRKESSMRKIEVFDSMSKMMGDESSDDE